MPKPICIAVELDEKSHDELLNWWNMSVSIPLLPNKIAHHMTIKYNPTKEELDKFLQLVGDDITLCVMGYGSDDKCQAVRVSQLVTDENSQVSNSNSHITVAIDYKNGGRAKQSNNLTYTRKFGQPFLTGKITIIQ
jgi:hypothetical protein